MKLIRIIIFRILLTCFLCGILYFCYKTYVKICQINHTMQDNRLMITSLYEAYSNSDVYVKLDTSALKVLCLGNSITHHAPSKGNVQGADSMWRGNWGMCASRQDSDYMHRLEHEFRKHNKQTKFTRLNVWEWESDYTINKDSLLRDYCENKDLIIIRVGENARDTANYRNAFADLVSYCRRFTPNVIITGLYWRDSVKEKAMIEIAREQNLPYVPLFWIFESYQKKVMFHIGDTLYDTRGNPYPLATKFICTHPNDEGMRMIADAIYKVIQFE